MTPLEAHPKGAVLSVAVHPGARRNEIRGVQDGQLKVGVTQAPEKGKANKAVIELVAKRLGVRKSQIELLAGDISRRKRFLISGVDIDELAARIERCIETGQQKTKK